jgi:hypothetical protein
MNMHFSAVENIPIKKKDVSAAPWGANRELITYDPAFDRDFTERLLGKGEGDVSRSTNGRIDLLWEEAASMLRPRLTYTVLDIDGIDRDRLQLANGLSFRSRKMAFALRHARRVIIFLATVGGKIDLEIDRLQAENRLADSYVLDAIGSGAVEYLADRFQRDMAEQLLQDDQTVGLRFSPGYCDWSVPEQQKVFACLDAASVGVHLSETSLMSPRKSISGLFGIFKLADKPENQPQNPCRLCAKKDCIARRAGQSPTVQ